MVDDVMAKPDAVPSPAEPGPARSDSAQAVPAARVRPGRLPLWLALVAAVGAGGVLFAAFPPVNRWWAAPAGVALLAVATYRRGFWAGALLGLLAGLAFLAPLLSWASYHVGSVWLFLPVGESVYFALLGGVSALASPVIDRWRWTWPWITGVLWVLQEALRDRTPFGGFPWGRLAFSQGDSPLLSFAALGGAPLVTFAVAVLGGLLLWTPVAFAAVWHHEDERVRARAIVPLVLAGAILLASVSLGSNRPVAAPSAEPDRRATVAIVQGNVPRLGLDFNAQRRAVLDNHVDATLALARDVAAGRTPRPDLVIWPENASDIDPIVNADARARINEAADTIGVPILVGGLLNGPANNVRNVAIVWKPGVGPTDMYVKRHPVPFAEYMPIRSFARMITEKVDLVRSDFVAGPEPGVLTVGPATVGDVICFEVAYDEVVRDTVTGGAGLLVVQTNNATFDAAEASQQLAMVRLRAVEHGRSALMASTVGVSAVVDRTGAVFDATPFNVPAVIVRDVQLTSSRTIATELGFVPELALVVVALIVVVTAIVMRRRRIMRAALDGGGVVDAEGVGGAVETDGVDRTEG